jgi:hypothetical protein
MNKCYTLRIYSTISCSSHLTIMDDKSCIPKQWIHCLPRETDQDILWYTNLNVTYHHDKTWISSEFNPVQFTSSSPINLILCHRCHCWKSSVDINHLVTIREPMGWVATPVIYLPFCTTERELGKKIFTSLLKLRFHSSQLNRMLSTDL